MKLKVSMQLNEKQNVEIEFENPNIQDLIKEAGVVLDFDFTCPICKNTTNFKLRTRIAGEKNYKYTEFVCSSCGATRSSGAYQDGSGLFLKEWKEAFKKEG